MFFGGGRIFSDHRICHLIHIHGLKIRQDQLQLLKEQDIVDQRNDLLDIAGNRIDPSWVVAYMMPSLFEVPLRP
jgi:hypothetical protein